MLEFTITSFILQSLPFTKLMALTKDQVRHLAKLARLNLTEEEVEKFTTQFGSIFKYIDMIQEVNTDDVIPTAQVTGLTNVMQADSVEKSLDRDEVLKVSQREKARGMIKVRKSI